MSRAEAVAMVVLLVILVGGVILIIVDDIGRTARCAALGGVRVESQCAKIEIIKEYAP